jgi:hypothetical protein
MMILFLVRGRIVCGIQDIYDSSRYKEKEPHEEQHVSIFFALFIPKIVQKSVPRWVQRVKN